MRDEITNIITDYIYKHQLISDEFSEISTAVRWGFASLSEYKKFHVDVIKAAFEEGNLTFKQYNTALKMVDEIKYKEDKEKES